MGAAVALVTYALYKVGLRRRWWCSPGNDRRGTRGGDRGHVGNAVENDGGAEGNGSEGDGNREDDGGRGGSDGYLNGTASLNGGGIAGGSPTGGGYNEDGDASDTPPSPRSRDYSFESENSTEELLAEADDLIAAGPPELPGDPPELPGLRQVSGDDVDALVNFTRRVLARDPVALSEIADDSPRGSSARAAGVGGRGETHLELNKVGDPNLQI